MCRIHVWVMLLVLGRGAFLLHGLWGGGFPTGGHLRVLSHGEEQGLSSQACWAVAQDHVGFLWVGTESGLFRFDGQRFQRFGDGEGLGSSHITRLLVDGEGNLWAGGYGGLYAWSHAQGRFLMADWERFEGGTQEITALASSRTGGVWAGTSRGLWLRERPGQAFRRDPLWEGQEITALAVGQTGGLWLAVRQRGESRLYRLQGGQPFCQTLSADLIAERLDALWEDREGNAFIRTTSGLWVMKPGGSTRRIQQVGGAVHTGSLWGDSKGRLWAPARDGIWCLDHQGWNLIDCEPEVLGGGGVRGGLLDQEGSLWLAGNGLFRIPLGRGAWRSFDEHDGLPGRQVRALALSRGGAFWVGTDNGVALWEGQRFRALTETAGLVVRSLLQDLRGRIYGAGVPVGVWRLDPSGEGMTWYGREEGVWGGARVFDLLLDRAGQLWVATDGGGLLRGDTRKEPLRFVREPLPAGQEDERVRSLYEDGEGRLWVAASGGLAVRQGKDWRRLGPSDGLLRRDTAIVGPGWGGAGLLVVYFEHHGMSRFHLGADGGLYEPEHFRGGEPGGLPLGSIYQVGEDPSGNLWVGSGLGMMMKTRAGEGWDHFGEQDGLPGNDTSFQCFLAGEDGRVWVGTSAGLVGFDPGAYRGRVVPRVRLSRLQFGAQSWLGAQDGVPLIPFSQNELELSLGSLTFVRRPSDLHFEVFLEGKDLAWHQAEGRQLTYLNLSAGDYRLRLRARIGFCPPGPEKTLAFTILPAWWQTWTFRLLGGLLVLGLVVLGYRLRVSALHRRNRQLDEEVRRRTQELEELNAVLERQNVTDPLTGLKNRRYLKDMLPQDVAQVRRSYRSMAVGLKDRLVLNVDLMFLMIDLDHFKAVNDRLGHAAGDQVLRQAAEVIRNRTRDSDTTIRWGGEEFLVVARRTARQDASMVAERIRSGMAEHPFLLEGGHSLRMTCSVGFSFYPFFPEMTDFMHWEKVIDLADRCLYLAKEHGRNAWVGVSARTGRPPDNPDRDPDLWVEQGLLQLHASPGIDLQALWRPKASTSQP